MGNIGTDPEQEHRDDPSRNSGLTEQELGNDRAASFRDAACDLWRLFCGFALIGDRPLTASADVDAELRRKRDSRVRVGAGFLVPEAGRSSGCDDDGNWQMVLALLLLPQDSQADQLVPAACGIATKICRSSRRLQ